MNWPISARRLASASLLSAPLLFAAIGCEDASDLGVDLPGTSATSTEYRDFPVTASTVLQDSLETMKTGTYLVGRVRDNALGTTTARGYFNLKLSPPIGDTIPANVAGTAPNPQLDSVVVVMPFDNVYGSASSPLQVNVYPLVAPLDEQRIYNSSSSVAVDIANPLGTGLSARLNGNRIIRRRNNATSQTDTTTFRVTEPDKTVRLKLNINGSAVVRTIFERLADKSTPFNQARLDAVLKGISVQPTAGFASAVVGFPTTTAFTRLVFHYHYSKKVGAGSLRGAYTIPFGNRSAYGAIQNTVNAPRYFTEIITDPAAPFNRLQGAGGSSQSVAASDAGDAIYAQAGSGFSAKLEIPGLVELKQEAQPQAGSSPAIAINRAELLVPVRPYTNLLFQSPANAFLYEVNASNEPLRRILLNSRVERLVLREGANQLAPAISSIENGFTPEGTPVGYYQQAAPATLVRLSDVNQSYGLLMTGYVQAYVYDKLDGATPAAFLFSPMLRNSGALGLERAVLDGTGIKLRVYYSRLR